jgi:hypothetical protein
MKFLINENSNLVIIDDKKETIINTDRYELTQLMKHIQEYLIKEDTEKSAEDKKGYTYRYNPRSRRIEKSY